MTINNLLPALNTDFTHVKVNTPNEILFLAEKFDYYRRRVENGEFVTHLQEDFVYYVLDEITKKYGDRRIIDIYVDYSNELDKFLWILIE